MTEAMAPKPMWTRPRPGRKPKALRDRILESVVVTDAGCWEWQKMRNPAGYGRMWTGSRRDGKLMLAHRVAYAEFVGPIPDGLVMDHLCRNPPCCNPEHLEPVTQLINVRRGEAPSVRQGRQTHCKRDHEFTPENTMVNKGKRYCLTCHRLRRQESQHA